MKDIILYPTDFSQCAENALSHALTVAKVLNCKIQIVHSLDFEQKDMTTLSLIEKVKKEAELKIQELKEENTAILALVMEKQSALGRLIFGSLTDKMVHHANIPLLVFPNE